MVGSLSPVCVCVQTYMCACVHAYVRLHVRLHIVYIGAWDTHVHHVN